MKTIGQQLVESLEDFLHRLESGEPIECTQVQRFGTPDGPMHIQTRKVLDVSRKDRPGQDGE